MSFMHENHFEKSNVDVRCFRRVMVLIYVNSIKIKVYLEISSLGEKFNVF